MGRHFPPIISPTAEAKPLTISPDQLANIDRQSWIILGIVFITLIATSIIYLVLKFLHCHEQQRFDHGQTAAIRVSTVMLRTLMKIPVVAFKKDSSCPSTEELDSCPICLEDFVEGENVKVLPRCKHMYHKGCIDQWFIHQFLVLQSALCPVCRKCVIDDATVGSLIGSDNYSGNRSSGNTWMVQLAQISSSAPFF